MPKIKVQEIDLYYEVHGEGDPLMMIRGLGSNADHWYAQVPAFSKKFRVIIFDNRGVGRSDKPDIPYTIQMMAQDTVGLMNGLNIPRAHILGISMGGMIAQEIAIRYPEKVHGLVLGCTHCGGKHVVPADEGIGRLFGEYILTGSEEAAGKTLKALFAEKTLREHPEIPGRYQDVSKRFPSSQKFLIRQLEAVQGHDSWEDLVKIKAPTLVLTGSEDVLVPPQNSRILAERIPQARLEVIKDGGHQFLVERADAFNQRVVNFLSTLSG
jgi:3-oxoadipate enol-lactonase